MAFTSVGRAPPSFPFEQLRERRQQGQWQQRERPFEAS